MAIYPWILLERQRLKSLCRLQPWLFYWWLFLIKEQKSHSILITENLNSWGNIYNESKSFPLNNCGIDTTDFKSLNASLKNDYCSFLEKDTLHNKLGAGNITTDLRHYCNPLYMARGWYLWHNYIPPYTLSWCLIIRLILDD